MGEVVEATTGSDASFGTGVQDGGGVPSKAQASTSPSDGSHLAHSTEIRKASHLAATALSRCSS